MEDIGKVIPMSFTFVPIQPLYSQRVPRSSPLWLLEGFLIDIIESYSFSRYQFFPLGSGCARAYPSLLKSLQ